MAVRPMVDRRVRRPAPGRGRTAGLGVLAALILLAAPAFAQTYTLRIDSAVVGEGQSFEAVAELDAAGFSVPAWSFGVCHDPLELELTSVASGAATATVRLGGPPEFESLDLYIDGLTHGVVVCFDGCDTLPVGPGQPLVEMTYTALGSVGTITDACFCGSLGVPEVPVLIVYDVASQATPTMVCGSFEIQEVVAPVTGLSCNAVEIECRCDADLGWTNAEAYDEIRIYRDGVLFETLPGDQTGFTASDEVGLHTFCVEAVRNGVASEQVCCDIDCPVVTIPAVPVENLTCVVDQDTCIATVTWTNPVGYEEITVAVDGALVETLTGLDSSTTIDLGGMGAFEVCIGATTFCGDSVPDACCTAGCGGLFARGDVNQDGTIDIADPVAMLGFLFTSAPLPDCDDALDTNDDGGTDIADPIYVLGYLFVSGPEPPLPFGACGVDPTPDGLLCLEFNACP